MKARFTATSCNTGRLVAVAVAVAMVFLALQLVPDPHPPVGLPVMTPHETSASGCGDGRTVAVQVLGDGVVKLDGDLMTIDRLEQSLEGTYRTMAERVIFLDRGEETRYDDVIRVIEIAQPIVDYVALVSPSSKAEPCLALPGTLRSEPRARLREQ